MTIHETSIQSLRKLIGVDKEYHGLEARHSALAMERHKLVRELEVAEHEAGIDDLVEEERGESIPTAHVDFVSWADRTPDPGPRRPTVLTGKLDRVKIYVYDLPSKFNKDMVKRYRRCASDQYGTEVFFHEALTRHGNEFRTMKPEEADFFFVPIYGECFLWQHEMLRGDGHEKSFKLTNDFFNEALDLVKAKGFWDKSGGRDHVFVFPGARGPTIFSDWRSKIRMSVYLTPEGDRKASYFNTWKDIVIPGMEFDPQFYTESSRNELITAYGKDRQFLSFFRGTIDHKDGASYSRGLRPRLKNILANEKDVIYDKKRKDCDRRCYRKEMAQSKFCLNPLGWTPWTLRFYQALMTRCIPVMIADDIEFPFENEVDYTEFALKIPEKDVDNIVALMRGMSDEELERRRDVMDRIWKKYTYQRPPQPGDAFYSTMEELARKRKRHRDAPGRLLP